MTNNDYIITEVLSEKRIFQKQVVINYILCDKNGIHLAMKKNKDDFPEIIIIYEKYKLDPIYKVFKLGSGEFQVMQKSNFQRDGNWYCPIYQPTYYGAIAEQKPLEYFDTLDAACKKLLEYEKIASRTIKEPVDCV